MSRREEIISQIRKVAMVYLPPGTSVFIFGSQANLKDLVKSDFDIGVKARRKLNRRTIWEFKEALNSTPNLYTFDVVDFGNASDSFKKIANQKIEYLIP